MIPRMDRQISKDKSPPMEQLEEDTKEEEAGKKKEEKAAVYHSEG